MQVIQNWMIPVIYYPSNMIFSTYLIQNSSSNSQINQVAGKDSDKKKKYFDFLKAQLEKKYKKTVKKIWTSLDDEILMLLREKTCCWNEISSKIQNTNPRTCQRRYKRLLNCRERWPKELDLSIKDLYENQRIWKWEDIRKKICIKFPKFTNYSSKKLKERYLYFLQDGILNKQWTIEQDLKLLTLLEIFGRKWRKLTQYFEGRTELQLKNRYKGTLKFIEIKVFSQLIKLGEEF